MNDISNECYYEGIKTLIEKQLSDDKFIIHNPYWESDEDDEFMPFFIEVYKSEIEIIKNVS